MREACRKWEECTVKAKDKSGWKMVRREEKGCAGREEECTGEGYTGRGDECMQGRDVQVEEECAGRGGVCR